MTNFPFSSLMISSRWIFLDITWWYRGYLWVWVFHPHSSNGEIGLDVCIGPFEFTLVWFKEQEPWGSPWMKEKWPISFNLGE